MRTLISALLGSTIAAGLGVSAVQAADLPRRTIVAPAPVVAVPVFTWTGFYIGANAGYGFSNSDTDDASTLVLGNNLFVPAAPSGTLTAVTMGSTSFLGYDTGNKRDGFVGGGQIGYNYQFTPGSGFVIGVEADAQYAGFNRNSDSSSAYYNTTGFLTAAAVPDGVAGLGIVAPVTGAAGNVALFNNAYGFANRNIDWFATVRGRVGYAIDRLLIYGTAGVAFTDRNNSDCTYCTGYGFASGASVPTAFFASTAAATAGALVTPSVYSTTSSNNVGYAVGGGLEYAFTNNLTAKLEGLYVNFDRGNRNAYANAVVGVTNTGAPVTAARTYGASNQRDDFGVVRLGLNYKFSAF
jgi:outer membrane immunogenic protein